MQSIEIHRAVIGNFYARIAGDCSTGIKSVSEPTYGVFSNDDVSGLCHIVLSLIHNLVVMIIYANLHIAAFRYTRLLAEGIESNPGPAGNVTGTIASSVVNIKKHVFASFHQGHAKFGYSAGIQCTSNAYLAICFSLIKTVSAWKNFDLDYILDEGDRLFKLTGIMEPLAVDELPTTFDLEGCRLVSSIMFSHSGLLTDTNLFNHHTGMLPNELGNGAIFTCAGFSIALIWHKNGVFVFDSHSRNSSGEHVENGYAVLLEFPAVSVANRFLKTTLYDKVSAETQYDLTYIKVDISETSLGVIRTVLKRRRRNENRKRKSVCLSGNTEIACCSKNMFCMNYSKAIIFEQNQECDISKQTEVQGKQKQYYIRKKTVILEQKKDYYLRNKEKILDQQHYYHVANKQSILERKNSITKIIKKVFSHNKKSITKQTKKRY